jgi:hypothetical protein
MAISLLIIPSTAHFLPAMPCSHGLWQLFLPMNTHQRRAAFLVFRRFNRAATRVVGRKHFTSDVIVGSAAGYLIGRYVFRAHHHAGN